LLIDAKAAARLLGIGERLLGLMTASGEIPSLKVRRRRLYPVESLRRWIEVRSGGGTP
jgi:excisionase family DNA binding protein